MKVSKKAICLLLALVIALAMTGCGKAGAPAEVADQNAAAQSNREFINVYVNPPVDWKNVHVWAWKDGGEDAFDAWPGMEMVFDVDVNPTYFTAAVPGWIDRIVISGNDGTVQTADLVLEQGKDVWVAIGDAGEAYCMHEDPLADMTEVAAQTAAAQPNREFINVCVSPPWNWENVHVWAWKDGGEDAFDAWPGMEMVFDANINPIYFTAAVPGWIDRIVISGNDGTVQTADLVLEQGKDVWVLIGDNGEANCMHKDPLADMAYEEPAYDDPLFAAASAGDFETVKAMLPTIQDRSILTDWAFNDFNYEYALEAVRNGDYATAIEFFGYCASEDNQKYGEIIQCLVNGDEEGAIAIRMELGTTALERDLDMDIPEIICMVTGVKEDPSDLNYILKMEYLKRRMRTKQPELKEEDLTFGESSSWEAEGYVGEIADTETYIPVANLNTLYNQCGKEPNGKVLVLRSQKGYPNGATYYSVDTLIMHSLSYDLYPDSLAEVEYIILANYAYNNEGRYKQTMSMGSNSVTDYFNFLRMKGQVQLINAVNRQTIQQSQWIMGTGEPGAYFGDTGYQCSNMPETAKDIIAAVEKVRELNAAK